VPEAEPRLDFRDMSEADIEGGLRLSRASGWNQTRADWRLLLSLGAGLFCVAVEDGRIVGSGGAVRYGDALAWICMILVDPARFEAVVAIKVAPFNRYETLDVARALAASGRAGEVALYTGNDDAIVSDLLADFPTRPGIPPIRFVGGLLGQWAVWTRRAVELLQAVKACRHEHGAGALALLGLGQQLTDANAALFDARNGFRGCIPGIHEVLRRQGLLAGTWCLDPEEQLSPGQADEIERVMRAYPHLSDDQFVRENRERWLR
jgi:hypothetical protein